MQACQDFKRMFVVNSRPLLRDEMDPKGVAVDNLQGWTQEFRTPDLEEEYADWVARSVLWRDRMHGVISAAWDALAVWSIRGHSVPERHSLALTVPFTALACTAMLLPCLWPKLWIRHRHNLVALCMVSHTIVFAVFMSYHSIVTAVLGHTFMARVVSSGVGGPAMLSVNYECVPLPKKLATLAACTSINLAVVHQQLGAEGLPVMLAVLLFGVCYPMVLSWRAEYRMRFKFLRKLTPGARPEAGRPSAWTLLGGAWLLPHSITLSMTVMPLLCISMLARHFSAASVLGVELLTAVLQATTYFKLYIGDTDCFQR
ncbi:hypothetical protein ACKKBG_A03930 [Auxenochlorella protothecoides x Auxenochlorella symbiontica]